MEQSALIALLAQHFPEIKAEEGRQWVQVTVTTEEWRQFALALRNNAALSFDYLFCLTCVDIMNSLEMVYHFESFSSGNVVVVKVALNRENPVIHTVSDIWRTAEFHEREVYEMFGVHFADHPDLRKLILPDDWQGYPMRKDYEDPVNMIKL